MEEFSEVPAQIGKNVAQLHDSRNSYAISTTNYFRMK